LPDDRHCSRGILVAALSILLFALLPAANSTVTYTATTTITPKRTTLTLWVNAYDGSVPGSWTKIGTSPYLNAQDQPTNYGYSANHKDFWGIFSFQTTNETGTITSVNLYLYAKTTDASPNSFSCFVNSVDYSVSLPTSWGWVNVNVTATLSTWQTINAAKLELETVKNNGPTISVDTAYIQVQYNP
jgi:hypothetical protein